MPPTSTSGCSPASSPSSLPSSSTASSFFWCPWTGVWAPSRPLRSSPASSSPSLSASSWSSTLSISSSRNREIDLDYWSMNPQYTIFQVHFSRVIPISIEDFLSLCYAELISSQSPEADVGKNEIFISTCHHDKINISSYWSFFFWVLSNPCETRPAIELPLCSCMGKLKKGWFSTYYNMILIKFGYTIVENEALC